MMKALKDIKGRVYGKIIDASCEVGDVQELNKILDTDVAIDPVDSEIDGVGGLQACQNKLREKQLASADW